MINLDQDIHYTSIDTRVWLDTTCGPVHPQWLPYLESLDDGQDSYNQMMRDRGDTDAWLLPERPYTGQYWINSPEMERAIQRFLEEQTGRDWVPVTRVDNVYNYEQAFERVFQYQIWVPEEDAEWGAKTREWTCDEWYYKSDVAVATEVHIGGDVRGNYGTVQLRMPDHSNFGGLAEGGFLDWVIGWHVVDFETGAPVEDGDLFQVGYASNPTYGLTEALDGYPELDDSGEFYVGELNGQKVRIYPEVWAY